MTSTFDEIRSHIAADLDRLDAVVRSQLATDNPLMQKVIDNYLKTKGKLIRPIIVILTARLMGRVDSKVLAAAAAAELLHNASLIHDDVVDQASLRRSLPTVNAVWDNHIAVLVGDFFVSSSMQQAISTGDLRIIDALCHLGKLLSLGELDQIYSARYHTIDQESYMRIIDYKTASLFVACARMGCYATGGKDADTRVRALTEYARLLGLSFQIRDDIFDYYDSAQVGKPTGNDLREGKITLPLLHVLLNPGLPQHEQMLALAHQPQLDDRSIALLTAYARDHGGIDYAYQCMQQMRDRGHSLLAAFPDNRDRQLLQDLFDFVISRPS